MSAIHDMFDPHGDERLQVLLFHGLGGHYRTTWSSKSAADAFWPRWLCEDASGVGLASVEYDASLSHWLSSGMTIADRAANIAALLAAAGRYQDTPIALIGHSLGGNIIKAVIRHLKDHASSRPEYSAILNNIRLVIFLGTPHTGSRAQRQPPRFLQKLLRYTPVVTELDEESPVLRDLGLWYRSNMPSNAKHVALVESRRQYGFTTIVSNSSSDPGLTDVVPIPVDADHISISKPESRQSEIYQIILDSVKSTIVAGLPPLLRDPPALESSPVDRTRRRRQGLNSRLEAHRKSLISSADEKPFTILLCGPSTENSAKCDAAHACLQISEALTKEGFDVVLGQSAGLENPRFGEIENSLSRELNFISSKCNAVIVIASGASSWSELSLLGGICSMTNLFARKI